MTTDDIAVADLKRRWRKLDDAIRIGWDGDMRTARESDVVEKGVDWTWTNTISTLTGSDPQPKDNSETLLYLPFQFRPGAGRGAFPEMFAWDSYFVNIGLMRHERHDLVRGMLLNHLFMIMRYGKVLNANRTYFTSRSQPPLHADGIWRYFVATGDRDIIMMAYPLLCREYEQFWLDADHSTPTGLSRHNDTTDPFLRRELAAEAETGFDFCALFEGKASSCVSVALNAQLVRYCEVLALIAERLGLPDEAKKWQASAKQRADRLNALCWNDQEGFYFEYNFVEGRQTPVWSLSAYWAVWAGVANSEQTERMAKHIARFSQPRGLTVTDKFYPSPHPEFPVLQWAYPFCWPPLMMMVVESMRETSAAPQVREVATNYLKWVIDRYEATGTVWEKYVAVPDIEEQAERYGTVSFYSWSCASVVEIGRQLRFDT